MAEKPVITVAKGIDRVAVEMSVQEAVDVHGLGAVFVDGVAYTEHVAKQKEAERENKIAEQEFIITELATRIVVVADDLSEDKRAALLAPVSFHGVEIQWTGGGERDAKA